MKKMILSAFCLGLCFASVNALAINKTSNGVLTVSFLNDERKVIKTEELPEAVTKALSMDAYKGWTIKEAALVNTKPVDQAQASVTYYEVVLTNGADHKTVKFQKDGTLLN